MAVKLEVNLETRNVGITEDPNFSVSDVLTTLAERIRGGSEYASGDLRDINGAVVGTFVFDATAPDD